MQPSKTVLMDARSAISTAVTNICLPSFVDSIIYDRRAEPKAIALLNHNKIDLSTSDSLIS